MIHNDGDFEIESGPNLILNSDELRITTFLSDTKDSATLMIIGNNIKGTLQISSSVSEEELNFLAKILYNSLSDSILTSFDIHGDLAKC